MDGTEYRFEKNSRVRLRDGVDPSFYEGMSTLGNEGWIVARRKDKFDLPQVYIHWDTNHWTYNGAPDRWTFEEHFDLVEEPMSDSDKKAKLVKEAASQFTDQLAAIFDSTPDAVESGETDDSPSLTESDLPPEILAKLQETFGIDLSKATDRESQYNKAMEDVVETLKQCEAFTVVAVRRREHEGATNGILIPTAIEAAKTDEAALLVEANVSLIGAKNHQELAVEAISSLRRGSDA